MTEYFGDDQYHHEFDAFTDPDYDDAEKFYDRPTDSALALFERKRDLRFQRLSLGTRLTEEAIAAGEPGRDVTQDIGYQNLCAEIARTEDSLNLITAHEQ